MSKCLKVIYENGVFHPLEPVSFREQEQVTVLILDKEEASAERSEENCYDTAIKAGIVGMVADAPSDLSTNPKYFEGFGH